MNFRGCLSQSVSPRKHFSVASDQFQLRQSVRASVSQSLPIFFERMRTRIAYDARRALHVAVHIKREEQFSEIIHKLSSEPTTTST